MCLVFIGFRVDQGHPVLIGANREEARSRPATPPVCVRSGPLRCLLAGADHGPDGTAPRVGTWLGVNETGLVVAVTNRRDGELSPSEPLRSRGWLAVELLGFEDPGRAVRHARGDLTRGGYGGVNFLIAGPSAAFVVQAPGPRRITVEGLRPGVHAITNLDLDDGADPRIRIVHEGLEPGQFVASARRICRDERVVIAGADRGTVSSSLIVVGGAIDFYHILGDPAAGEYESFRAFHR
jgi:uncharacterized protein with NRDE domain